MKYSEEFLNEVHEVLRGEVPLLEALVSGLPNFGSLLARRILEKDPSETLSSAILAHDADALRDIALQHKDGGTLLILAEWINTYKPPRFKLIESAYTL